MKHASIVRVLFFFRRGDLHMVFVLFLFAIHKVSITKVFKFLGFNLGELNPNSVSGFTRVSYHVKESSCSRLSCG